jgi:hypothetical protein
MMVLEDIMVLVVVVVVVAVVVGVVDMLLLLFWLVDGFGERGLPYIEKVKKRQL